METEDFRRRLRPHLEYAERLTAAVSMPQSRKSALEADLRELRRRLDDPCVDVAVVGEFSAGKSSFLNALLGVDLLAVDELPDTTLAPTVMSWGPEPAFRRVRTAGAEQWRPMALPQIRAVLASYAMPMLDTSGTQEEYEERHVKLIADLRKRMEGIERFEIRLPSPFLKRGFRLTDTPGINSGNNVCGDLARKAMSQADASIIIGDASHMGLTESLRYEMKNFIGPRLRHCIMICTRYDLTSPRTRPKLEKYLRTTLPAYFGLTPDQMPVLMAVPPTVTAEARGARFGAEHDVMLALTQYTFTELERLASERRRIITAEALQDLLGRICGSLGEHLDAVRSRLGSRLEQLELSRTIGMDEFVKPHYRKRTDRLEEVYRQSRASLDAKVAETMDVLEKIWHDRVFVRQDTAKKLRDYLRNKFADDVELFANERLYPLAQTALGHCMGARDAQRTEFDGSVKEEFKRLSLIPVDFEAPVIPEAPPRTDIKTLANNLAAYADRQVKDDNRSIGGAVIGGILGSIVAPGIGTAVGAALGGIFSSNEKGSGITGARDLVRPKYEEEMKNITAALREDVMQAFDTPARQGLTAFYTYMKRYPIRYREKVDAMIAREAKDKAVWLDALRRTEADMAELETHRKEMEKICKTI